jgi:DNA helicase-2/ATP-dependent DNA helicase PcrA
MGWADGLDPKSVSYAIADCSKDRIRVVAGPGTGKSFAMKRRVAKLLETGAKPNEILPVTFTRVAAEDLHRELVQLKVPGCDQLEGRTLHSLGLRILARKHVLTALGRIPRPLSLFEVNCLVCDLSKKFSGKKNTKRLLGEYLSAWAVAQGDVPGFPAASEQKGFADDLLAWMKFHGAMLIGEIVPYLLVYLKNNPKAKEHTEFKHILLDEYQDFNQAEQRIMDYLGANAQVCIVGDDDQSIYSFKYAHPEGIRDWHKVNKGVEDFALDECHRCPTTVVAMANSLIANNKQRTPRQLKEIAAKGPGHVEIIQHSSADDEADWISKKVQELIAAKTADAGEIIVLVQRRLLAREILERLRKLNVSTKSFFEESQLDSKEAQEKFALFKLFLDNSDRVALRYLIGIPSEDFRAGAYARLRPHCESSGDSSWDALEKLEAGQIKLKQTQPLVDRFKEIKAAIAGLDTHKGNLAAFVDHIFPSGDEKLEELRELALTCLKESNEPAELLKLMMEELTQPEIPPTVTDVRIMSLNKSKGLSSPFVFVSNCVQGVLPKLPDPKLPKVQQDAQLEEQRRLFFVAITRVKSDPPNKKVGSLYLTYSETIPNGLAKRAGIEVASAKWGVGQLLPSLFLDELGKSAPKPKGA